MQDWGENRHRGGKGAAPWLSSMRRCWSLSHGLLFARQTSRALHAVERGHPHDLEGTMET